MPETGDLYGGIFSPFKGIRDLNFYPDNISVSTSYKSFDGLLFINPVESI